MKNQTKKYKRSHRLYTTWHHMVERCNKINSFNYHKYGARGIKVCDSWLNMDNFVNDMFPSYQEGLTLDRINNDLGYSKDNCRWTTIQIQNRNTRKIRINNTSNFRGVSWNKEKRKWHSYINVNKKRKHLGYFNTALESAKAYDNYIVLNNLEHTRNF